MLSKLRTCSAINTASDKTLTIYKRCKRSVSKSWHDANINAINSDKETKLHKMKWYKFLLILFFKTFIECEVNINLFNKKL